MMRDPSDVLPRSALLRVGSTGIDVARLQHYLRAFSDLAPAAGFGVVREPWPAPPSGAFDEQTEQALRAFQVRYGLSPTGAMNAETIAVMWRPRCGVPDTSQSRVSGRIWTGMTLRYGFTAFARDVPTAEHRSGVAAAFGLWAAVTPLTFIPVSAEPEADIRIRCTASVDGADGPAIRRPAPSAVRSALADPAGGAHRDEHWSVVLSTSGVGLTTTAAHALGHVLGLGHSTAPDALMHPYQEEPHRWLHTEDIARVQALYGMRPRAAAQSTRVYAEPGAHDAEPRPAGARGRTWHAGLPQHATIDAGVSVIARGDAPRRGAMVAAGSAGQAAASSPDEYVDREAGATSTASVSIATLAPTRTEGAGGG